MTAMIQPSKQKRSTIPGGRRPRRGSGRRRKLVLRNFQSPGDIVMLTAAVRDLHRAYPR